MVKLFFKYIFKNLSWITLMILSLILIGVLELVQAGFDISVLLTANFWVRWFTMFVASLLMIIATMTISRNRIEANQKEGSLGKKATDLEEVVNKCSANIQNDIDRFIAETNLNRKKEAWKIKIKAEIYEISNSFNMNDHIQYAQYEKSPEYFDISRARPKVRKRINLEDKLDEKYIDENILNLKVKYNKVTRRMIENGERGDKDYLDGLSNGAIVFIKGVGPRFALSLSVLMFFSSFYFDKAEQYLLVTIISISFKLITLLMNANFGRVFAKQYFNETVIHDLQLRRQWLTKYNDWREAKRRTRMMDNILKSDLVEVHEVEEKKKESK